ncbi:MAG: NMD3-related protein [Candidatus Anstonellales archaeon]
MEVCIKCGAKRGTKQFKGLFCVDCCRWGIEIPKNVQIEVCKRCKRARIRGEWRKATEKELVEYLLSKIKGEKFERGGIDFKNKKAILYFMVDNNEMVRVERDYNFDILETICPDCSRKAGGYFEAIIQFRGNPKKYMNKKEKVERMLRKKTFITKEENLKEGVDLYIGSSKIVAEVLKELELKPVLSRKLSGFKEGKRLYRTTFMLRF